MAFSRRHTQPRLIAEINVTPFVDVMLVLLVIFMAAAPLLSVGVPVNLPETAARPTPTPTAEPLTLTIPAEGLLVLMEDAVADAELLDAVSARMGDTPGVIYLRADSAVPYGRIMEIMGALDRAGYSDIVLVTEPGGPTLDDGAP